MRGTRRGGGKDLGTEPWARSEEGLGLGRSPSTCAEADALGQPLPESSKHLSAFHCRSTVYTVYVYIYIHIYMFSIYIYILRVV